MDSTNKATTRIAQQEATALDWGRIISLALVIALAGGTIGFALGVWQAPNFGGLISPAVDPRAEYYRGAYDMCNFLFNRLAGFPPDKAIELCQAGIPKVAEQGWYELESPEYTPPPEGVPVTPSTVPSVTETP